MLEEEEEGRCPGEGDRRGGDGETAGEPPKAGEAATVNGAEKCESVCLEIGKNEWCFCKESTPGRGWRVYGGITERQRPSPWELRDLYFMVMQRFNNAYTCCSRRTQLPCFQCRERTACYCTATSVHL